MNQMFIYIISFNIIAIPSVIYFHIKGECQMLSQIFAGVQNYCTYITNPLMNLLFINVTFFVLVLLLHANSQIPQSQSYPKKPATGDFKKGK